MHRDQAQWVKHKIDVEKYTNKGKSILQRIRELFSNIDPYVYKIRIK